MVTRREIISCAVPPDRFCRMQEIRRLWRRSTSLPGLRVLAVASRVGLQPPARPGDRMGLISGRPRVTLLVLLQL